MPRGCLLIVVCFRAGNGASHGGRRDDGGRHDSPPAPIPPPAPLHRRHTNEREEATDIRHGGCREDVSRKPTAMVGGCVFAVANLPSKHTLATTHNNSRRHAVT
jgi:hypothetical protein